jgi:hypothetical protein
MKRRVVLWTSAVIALALLSAAPSLARSGEIVSPESMVPGRDSAGDGVAVPMDAAHWDPQGPDIGLGTYLGTAAIRAHAGLAQLRNVDFATGTIEYDVAFQRERAFIGIFDTIDVQLRRGRNEIAFVVEENSGGWAAEAQFEQRDRLHSPSF